MAKLSIELNKSTVIFGVILLALGYFAGNTLPIFGSTGTIVFDDQGNIVTGGQAAAELGGDTLPSEAPAAPAGQKIDLSPDDDPTIGDPNAPVQVYEFSDFQCPFCQRFYADAVKQMEAEYVDTGKVLFIYKDFPLQQIHPAATPAAIYANCAHEQGKWKEFHDAVFDQQHILGAGQAGLDQLAEQVGLDNDQLNACLADQDKHVAEIQNDLQVGSALGVTGTPSIFVGNAEQGFTQIRGAQPYSIVKQTIEQYL